MKNADWIYESGFPENEKMFKEIEAALGFKLFIWQKAYIITGKFRKYGKTTAEILKELLDVAGMPIDYTKIPQTDRERLYRRETRELQERLHKAGIKTRVIFWSDRDKQEYADMQQRRYRE